MFLLSWTLSEATFFSMNLNSSFASAWGISVGFSSSVTDLKLGLISSASLVNEKVNSTGLSWTKVLVSATGSVISGAFSSTWNLISSFFSSTKKLISSDFGVIFFFFFLKKDWISIISFSYMFKSSRTPDYSSATSNVSV